MNRWCYRLILVLVVIILSNLVIQLEIIPFSTFNKLLYRHDSKKVFSMKVESKNNRWIQWISSANLSLLHQNRSRFNYQNKEKLNYEYYVDFYLQKVFEKYNEKQIAPDIRKLLCTTFLKISIDSMNKLKDNIIVSRGYCTHWFVITYHNSDTAVHQNIIDGLYVQLKHHNISHEYLTFRFALSRLNLIPSIHQLIDSYFDSDIDRIIHQLNQFNNSPSSPVQTQPNTSDAFNDLTYPKSFLLLYLYPILPQYQRVWMMDSDISLKGFDYKTFHNIYSCSFSQIPLIVQPLITENTQIYPFLNHDSWEYIQHRKVLASTTGFIEIQVPHVDTLYLQWFIISFIIPTLIPSHYLGADWGYDELFCRSAQMFQQHLNNQSHPTGRERGREGIEESCMIVIGGTPIHHSDRKDMNAILGLETKKILNRFMIEIIRDMFPSYARKGNKHNPSINPLHWRSKLKKVSKLREPCEYLAG